MRDEAIKQFVRNLTTAWFSAPRGMDEAAQREHVVEIARAVNDALPLSLYPEQLEDALEGAKRNLLRSGKSRAWPIIREIMDAIRSELPRRGAEAEDDAEAKRKRIRLQAAKDWFAKFADLPGWCSDEDTVRALIADGIPAHDLWRGGVDVPRDLRDWREARQQRGTPAHKMFPLPDLAAE